MVANFEPSLPKCYFSYDTLKATIGYEKIGYTDLECIQVPPFKEKVFERECLGGGWYGSKV